MKRIIFVFSLLALFLGTTNTVSLARTNVTDGSCFTTSDEVTVSDVSKVTFGIEIKYVTPCPIVSLDQDGNKGLFSKEGLSAKLITLKSVYLFHGSTFNEYKYDPVSRENGSSGGLPYRHYNPLFA